MKGRAPDGGYHHHIGLNTWESEGGSAPPPGSTGLTRPLDLEALLSEADHPAATDPLAESPDP